MRFNAMAGALLAAGSLLVLASCASSASSGWSAAPVADPATVGFSKAGLDRIDAAMEAAVSKGEVAGVVTLLAKDGQVVDYDTFGLASLESGAPIRKDTIFRIFSMSKPITGVAMMQLYEQGKWKLDDPVTKFVPEFTNLKVLRLDAEGNAVLDASGKPVLVNPNRPATMRELMSHTAGLAYGLSGEDPANTAFRDLSVLGSSDLEEMITKMATIPLILQPGERWYYSAAVDVQGLIVQRLSGKRFGDYLQENLFAPMGMKDTAFYVTPDKAARLSGVYQWDRDTGKLASGNRFGRDNFTNPARLESGGGGLVSTIEDYARFCQMMLNKGELNGARILKPETVALMTQNHIGSLRLNSDGTAANPGLPGVGFGLDFAVVTDPAAAGTSEGVGTYYWGGAAGTWFWIDPTNNLYFIGMIQRYGGAGPNATDFRAESRKLVYEALEN